MSARVVKRKAVKKTNGHATKVDTHKTNATRVRAKSASSRVKSPKVSPRQKPSGGAAASGALGLKVRMYRVGFGDFFLVTVPTAGGNQYILIDCGVFKGTTGKGDIGSITDAVDDLYETTRGQLALVIMTHRHADHIAGFSRAPRFKEFKASMVWMPYWEQFNDAKESPNRLQADIDQLAFQLAMQFRGRTDPVAGEAFDYLWNATGIDFNAAAKGGQRGGGNAAALDLLKNHFGQNGKNVKYYAAGDKPQLPPELEGLSAHILGPPPKDAKAFVQLTDFKKNVGQYLDCITNGDDGPRAIQPFRRQWFADPQRDYPDSDTAGYSIDYKACRDAVDNAQPDMLAAAAAKIDTFLNNQSLVVLFQFADKKLLFVGDAQAGNWEHWLYKLNAPINDPTKAGDLTEDSKRILQTIDFYKVGHHGSTNATPIPVVHAFGTNHSANGFVAMCSTQPGVYGNAAKGTEVPRNPLMKALGDECTLIRSDAFEIKTSNGTVKAANGSPAQLPTPRVGTLNKNSLYVEYSF
jgi:hypothetical protein